MRTLFTLAATLFALPLAAQQQPTTWHGLRFGDTPEQVRAQLSAQNIETQSSLNGVVSATKDYDLYLPGLTNAVTLLPRFHFSKTNQLEDVTLPVDLAGMKREWAGQLGNDESTLIFAHAHLAGALAGLYGVPLYTSPGCDKDSAPSCVVFWKGNQQTIMLERSGSSLFIRYQMLATDL